MTKCWQGLRLPCFTLFLHLHLQRAKDNGSNTKPKEVEIKSDPKTFLILRLLHKSVARFRDYLKEHREEIANLGGEVIALATQVRM